MSECNTCWDTTSSGCISIPMNASAWNVPNFTGCELNSLPPGICGSEWDCIKKVPACSVEWGHALKLIKLSNYIDLDKLAKFNPDLVQTKFKNEDVLSAINCAPVLGLKSWINTVATQHCDGKWQIDLVSNIGLTETKKVQYCGVNGSSFFVASGEVNPDSIQVFINGILQTGTTPVYNGANTNVQLQSSVSNVCVDIFYEAKLPDVVAPDVYEIKVSDDDVAGYLENKVQGSNWITTTVQNFWGSEYIDFSLTNPTPTPGAWDVNKIIYVDENGNYSLGSPCCGWAARKFTGTDTVTATVADDELHILSNTIDVTFTDVDETDDIQEMNIETKPGGNTYVIHEAHTSVEWIWERTFVTGFQPSSYEIHSWDQTNWDNQFNRAWYGNDWVQRGIRYQDGVTTTMSQMIDIRFNAASTNRTRAEHSAFTEDGITLNFTETTQDMFFTIIAYR